jgi:CTP:molybdopterin cytidylyltransferase MocA
VILAAGRSTRFGDRHKALPEPYGAGLLAKAAGIFAVLGLKNVLVVTGYRAEEVTAEATRLGLSAVHNANFDQGMFSSAWTGLSAARGAALLLPVDAALVSPWAVLALIALWRSLTSSEQERAIVLPVHQGRTGHPPLLGPEVIKKVLSGRDNLRSALAEGWPADWSERFSQGWSPLAPPRQGPIRFLELADAGVLTDIDTPADHQAALDRPVSPAPWPSPSELWALLEMVGPGWRVQEHSLTVARGALRLGLALERVSSPGEVDPVKGFLGGVIHDVDRLQKKHQIQGQRRLLSVGWPDLAWIVGQHKDLDWPPEPGSPEKLSVLHGAMAVYLADKYALESDLVSLEERFGFKIDSFANPKARSKALARLENARRVASWLQDKLGQDPQQVVSLRSTHELETLADELARGVGR